MAQGARTVDSEQVGLLDFPGVPRDRVISEIGVLPAVRYAVDAYLALVTKHTFMEAVASSTTTTSYGNGLSR